MITRQENTKLGLKGAYRICANFHVHCKIAAIYLHVMKLLDFFQFAVQFLRAKLFSHQELKNTYFDMPPVKHDLNKNFPVCLKLYSHRSKNIYTGSL